MTERSEVIYRLGGAGPLADRLTWEHLAERGAPMTELITEPSEVLA